VSDSFIFLLLRREGPSFTEGRAALEDFLSDDVIVVTTGRRGAKRFSVDVFVLLRCRSVVDEAPSVMTTSTAEQQQHNSDAFAVLPGDERVLSLLLLIILGPISLL
jgi:hypothetical protein